MSGAQTDLMNESTSDKGDWVADLRNGLRAEGLYALAEVMVQKKKDGSPYLRLTLQDRTGTINAIFWEGGPLAGRLGAGTIVRVSGEVGEYRGKLQITVRKMDIVEEVIPRSYFLKTGTEDRDELHARLEKVLEGITTPYLKNLLDQLFEGEGLLEPYLEAPAAKLRHQAYIGGLAEHSINMAEHARYCSEFYPEADGDLLATAALLHDIGKIFEYRVDTVIDYSDEGRLEGHVVMGERLVRRQADSIAEFPEPVKMHLSHLILSHQGKLEYGSPVTPMTLEAVMLHAIDYLDSRVATFRDIRDRYRGEERNWSEYDRLDEQFWYLGTGQKRTDSESD